MTWRAYRPSHCCWSELGSKRTLLPHMTIRTELTSRMPGSGIMASLSWAPLCVVGLADSSGKWVCGPSAMPGLMVFQTAQYQIRRPAAMPGVLEKKRARFEAPN